MNDNKMITVSLILGGLCGIVAGVIIGSFISEPVHYKDGQVDALTGNIKYELITNPDSTKTWEEIGD